MEEAVHVREVRKDFGDLRALDGVSFSVARGEVSVLGVDPAVGGRAHRARIGVVTQEPERDGSCTPRDLVRHRAATYGHPRQVDEVLELVGLEDERDASIATLSLGEQRRVDLAVALIGGPELLFLDEPTTAFDPPLRRDVGAVVDGLGATGTTVVLATNRVAEARRFADRVGVLAAGEMIAVAPPDELAGRSGSERGIIRFRLPEHVAGCDLPDAGHLLTIGLDRMVELRSARPLRDLQWLTRWASEHDVPLDGLTITPPSFEEAYLELIGQA